MTVPNLSNRENTLHPILDRNDVFYNNRSEAYLREGKVDQAIDDFNIAVKLQPELVVVYSNRGNAYLLKGEIDKAIEDYSRSIKHAPNDAMSYSNRSVAYLQKARLTRQLKTLPRR